MLVGNNSNEPVIEMHFPASAFLFEDSAEIALSGADFGASINGKKVALHTNIQVNKDALFEFTGLKKGARCYLAVHGGWQAQNWLGSHSTNLRRMQEGITVRALKNMISFF